MTAIDIPPRTVIDYVNTLLETYSIAAETCPISDADAIEVGQNVKVPVDSWRGYVFMAGLFYPKTDGDQGCENFSKTIASRLRRALSIVLESTTRNERALTNDEADKLQEKIYVTLYPGGKLDVSSASEDEGDNDDESVHIVEIHDQWNGKKRETMYRVDFGRGDVRELTKYVLKQTFAEDWKNMVHRYKRASDKAMPTRMQLKGTGQTRREDGVRLTVKNGHGNHGAPENDRQQTGKAQSPRSEDTSGEDFYERSDKPQQGSTMVDSTDGRKIAYPGTRRTLHRLEGHGEGGLLQSLKPRDRSNTDSKVKHRMSEPPPRALGLSAFQDLDPERLANTGPVRKRQRISMPHLEYTGGTHPGGHAGTPLTGEPNFVAPRTDTATMAMEFMSKVLHNEDILRSKLEDLAAQNKYLQGLLEDEELATGIADNDFGNAKQERRERQQLEEVLHAREQELRSVKSTLKKLRSRNDHSLEDLQNEKEEWRAIATQAQDQLDKQHEQHSLEMQKLEREITDRLMEATSEKINKLNAIIQKREQEYSKQRDSWGKEAALKLNEIETLRTSRNDYVSLLKAEQIKNKSLENQLAISRSELEKQKVKFANVSIEMRDSVTRMKTEAQRRSQQAATVLLQADKHLSHAMAVQDAWTKVPRGLQSVQHLLEYEDATGEKAKGMSAEQKEIFLRLRPSLWAHSTILSAKYAKGTMNFTIKYTKPDTAPGASGSSLVFDVNLEELKKRDYCQRKMCEYFLNKVKPVERRGPPAGPSDVPPPSTAKPDPDDSQETCTRTQ